MRRAGLVVIAFIALVAAACVPPLSTPGDTASIQFVSTTNLNGWKYDYYRNNAYPCSVSGYQTFVIGTKIGSSSTDARAAVGVHARRRRRATSTPPGTRSRTPARRSRSPRARCDASSPTTG